MKKYIINAKGPKKAEVLIYDDIGAGWMGGVSAKQFAEDLKALGKLDEINVKINSNGGNVFEGVAIYNTLIKNSAKVIIDVDGIAASIASIVAMAGDEIRMAENAFLMIHEPWIVTAGSADELRDTAETMDKVRDTLLDTYAKRATASKEDISAWMKDETWFTAAEALEAGFVDSVENELKVAAHAAFGGHDLTKYKNVPQKLVSAVKEAADHHERPNYEANKSRIAHIKNRIAKIKQSLSNGA